MEPNADQSLSDEEEVFPQQTNDEHTQMDPQEEAASKLLQAEEQIQRNEGKISILSQDIESKLQQLFQDIKEDDGSNFQSAISLRMKELAYNKILVLTYERSYFRLVLAHFHIAKEYLRFKCYEQTISHIEQAISKNTKAALNRDNKLFHSYLFTYLAICLYHTKKIEQAQAEISKAINLQEQYEMNERVSLPNFKTLVYNAKIKAELKHVDALENMKDAVSKAQKYYENRKGQNLGLILYQYGKICLSLNKKQEAIRNYERAIQTIKMGNSPGHEEQIINIYYQLAEIYKNTNNEEYINILKLKYQVFEDTYGNSDKKSIIEQRNLAKAYLQQKKIEESLQEFEDILDKEKKVYGQNSIQVGKQLKSIANIYLAKHDNKQAIIHFKKALKIFHDLGDQRLVRQIRMRLAALQAQQSKH